MPTSVLLLLHCVHIHSMLQTHPLATAPVGLLEFCLRGGLSHDAHVEYCDVHRGDVHALAYRIPVHVRGEAVTYSAACFGTKQQQRRVTIK